MSIPEIVEFLRGYITIKIEGLNLEKFLNIAIKSGINIYNVKRINITTLFMKIDIRNYIKLRKILKKTNCKLYIINKKGLPFITFNIKKRKAFVFGIFIFILSIFVLSSFIWSIKIYGAKTISIDEIRNNLSEIGVKPGVFKLNIPVVDVEKKMLINMSKLSWIKLKIVGTRVEVEVKERALAPKEILEDTPCDIIADRDAIILNIQTQKGNATVSNGDPVKKGQILVSGQIKINENDIKYVHAAAAIEARTWYELSTAVTYKKIQEVKSGNKIERIYIVIGNSKYMLKNENIEYKYYEKVTRSIKPLQTDLFELPIELIIEEYYEKIHKEIILSEDEAKKEAIDIIEKEILQKIKSDAKILNKKINITKNSDMLIVNAIYETKENIGIRKEINENGEISIDR